MHFLKVLLLSIVVFGSFCQKKPAPEPTKIRSQILMYEYMQNIPAGEVKYKGKELMVKGPIVKADANNGEVMLEGAPSAVSNVVVCHFQDDQTRDKVRQAFNKQDIIVQGVNAGYSYEGVHLRPCRISKDPGPPK